MQSALPTAYANSSADRAWIGRKLYENGLSIVLLFTFFALLWAQTFTGWKTYNDEQREHGEQSVTYGDYLTTGHFVEATAENWESEFLQMAAFVWLTVFLVQKGSPEARSGEGEEEQDREPDPNRPGAPWPVRRGGIWLTLYSHSLTLAFLLMFLISFLLHAAGGAKNYFTGADRTRPKRGNDAAIHGDESVLVRVDAELAERIPRHRDDGDPVGFPAAKGLAREQAGGCAT